MMTPNAAGLHCFLKCQNPKKLSIRGNLQHIDCYDLYKLKRKAYKLQNDKRE